MLDEYKSNELMVRFLDGKNPFTFPFPHSSKLSSTRRPDPRKNVDVLKQSIILSIPGAELVKDVELNVLFICMENQLPEQRIPLSAINRNMDEFLNELGLRSILERVSTEKEQTVRCLRGGVPKTEVIQPKTLVLHYNIFNNAA